MSHALEDKLKERIPLLVSGVTIKTVNGEAILGSGNIVTGGGAAWGDITGTLANQTDLNNALAGKEPAKGADDNFVTDAEKTALHPANADTDLDATFEASLKNTDNHTSGTTNKVFTATEQTKLAGIATGAEVNVNADWNAGSGDSQIFNKPALGTAADNAETDFEVAGAVATHAGAADPHTGYQKESEREATSGYAGLDASSKVIKEPASKGAASGIAPLDAASKVPTVNRGGAGASGSNFLRGDQTWATPAGGGITTLRTTANQTINAGAATFVDITGLTFPVTAGVDYAFHFYITFRSAATTTGWKSGVNHPGGTLDFWAKSAVIANGAAGVATHTERHNVTVDDMTLLTATITAGVDLSIIIEGRYMCTSSGTFAARFANELASNTNLVIQKGSWGWYF